MQEQASTGERDTAQHDGLTGEAGAKAEEEPPLEALTGGGELLLHRLLAHVVHDEQHAGAGHVPELGQNVAAGRHLVRLELQLLLHLVQDGRPARVGDPEHIIEARGLVSEDLLEGILEDGADVLRNDAGHVLHEVEGQAHFSEMAIYGSIAVWEYVRSRPVDLKPWFLYLKYRIRPHYYR